MNAIRIILIAAVALGLAVPVLLFYFARVANPRVARALIDNPQGEQARKVMLLTLPSGRRIPVNYLREGDRIYACADGRWWRELAAGRHPVEVLVRGETLSGRARAVRDDPAHTKDVFSRLRPSAIPGFGTLVEVQLDAIESSGATDSPSRELIGVSIGVSDGT